MADTILIKRDSTPGLAPSTSQLALGELAVNTYDGKIYTKKNDGTDSIIEIGFPVPTDAVTTNSITDGSITTAKFAAGAIDATAIGAGSISTAKIATGAVTSGKIGANQVTTAKIAAGAVTSNELAADSVTSAKIVDGTIATGDLANTSITTAKIAANAVTSAKVDGTVATQTSNNGALDLPAGTTAQRDTTPGQGATRFSTTFGGLESYDGSNWYPLVDGGNGVSLTTSGFALDGTYSGSFVVTGDVTAYSDERLKHEWQNLEEDTLEKALHVKYGTYERKDLDPNTRHIGVSAQDLAKVFPEAARLNEDGYLSVNYGASAMALVLELNKKVAELEEQIKQLKDQ